MLAAKDPITDLRALGGLNRWCGEEIESREDEETEGHARGVGAGIGGWKEGF